MKEIELEAFTILFSLSNYRDSIYGQPNSGLISSLNLSFHTTWTSSPKATGWVFVTALGTSFAVSLRHILPEDRCKATPGNQESL